MILPNRKASISLIRQNKNSRRKPRVKTSITEMFGVETPIVMGGMTGVGYGELVAAVANAGALGFIVAHLFPTAGGAARRDRADAAS